MATATNATATNATGNCATCLLRNAKPNVVKAGNCNKCMRAVALLAQRHQNAVTRYRVENCDQCPNLGTCQHAAETEIRPNACPLWHAEIHYVGA